MISILGETMPRARRCACWKRNRVSGIQHAPIFPTKAQVVEARKSPEGLALRAKLRELASSKTMDKLKPRPYIPSVPQLKSVIRGVLQPQRLPPRSSGLQTRLVCAH
jgi:hypothetical protein